MRLSSSVAQWVLDSNKKIGQLATNVSLLMQADAALHAPVTLAFDWSTTRLDFVVPEAVVSQCESLHSYFSDDGSFILAFRDRVIDKRIFAKAGYPDALSLNVYEPSST